MSVSTQKTETHQEQLQRLQAEVESLREQLYHAQRLAAVGTMAAMVAHEFNNILTPIVNYAQLAKTNPSLAEKAIARAADGGQRATGICRAILGIAGGASEEPRTLGAAELVQGTLDAMARDPQRDAIELILAIPDDLALTTRVVELQQVLLNLLLNARAAVLAKNGLRKIEIRASRDGECVEISVRDNGVGIPAENIAKIFQPFFTTRKSDSGESRGNGLGLAICHDIMSRLGGEIRVQSKVGEGSTFTLCLKA